METGTQGKLFQREVEVGGEMLGRSGSLRRIPVSCMSLGQGWVRNDGAPDEFGKLRPLFPGMSQESAQHGMECEGPQTNILSFSKRRGG